MHFHDDTTHMGNCEAGAVYEYDITILKDSLQTRPSDGGYEHHTIQQSNVDTLMRKKNTTIPAIEQKASPPVGSVTCTESAGIAVDRRPACSRG
jgi:hypothetical protein